MGVQGKLRVGVVGMGFGQEFVPIYLDHPDVERVVACDLDPEAVARVCGKFKNAESAASFDALVADPDLDAIHIVTGLHEHVPQTLATLAAGKHCACTVPMAMSIRDLQDIVKAQKESGKNYMMMETSVYTRQFFYAKELAEKGDFGRIQFLRGAHYQDLEAWPHYWYGLPPLWYATHAVAPLLCIANTRAVAVHCFGSGRMRQELVENYGNPYPMESAIFQLETPDLAAEVTRSLFHGAREYMESFAVYGENACYEWQMESKPPALFRSEQIVPGQWRKETVEYPEPPDRADLLPPKVGRYTRRFVYGEGDETHMSFQQGGGHHGSHPHMVHEFVRSIVEERKPWIDSVTAADWCAAGICAHESAMNGGARVDIPAFG
jgi:predicted dehydrogenase